MLLVLGGHKPLEPLRLLWTWGPRVGVELHKELGREKHFLRQGHGGVRRE